MGLRIDEFLGYFLNETGLTQMEFAEKFNVSIASVYKWLSHEHIPSRDFVQKLLGYCNLNKIEIYDFTWNDYIDDILSRYDLGAKYERVGDFDAKNNRFNLLCNDCGRISTVPIEVIDSKSKRSLCLNCWRKNREFPNGYKIRISERLGYIKIVHQKCGSTYKMNLKEIKLQGIYCESCRNNRLSKYK